MPAAKDLYFFDRYYDRGRDWYLGQFADATAKHQVVGEVCQDYLFEPLARIASTSRWGRSGSWSRCATPRTARSRPTSTCSSRVSSPGPSSRRSSRDPSSSSTVATPPASTGSGGVRRGRRLRRGVRRPRRRPAGLSSTGCSPGSTSSRCASATSSWPPGCPQRGPARARCPGSPASSADVVREKLDGANLIGRVKRSTLVQRMLYVPLGDDKPTMTAEERAAVHDALGSEISALDDEYGLGLARRWGWAAGHRRQPQGPGRRGMSALDLSLETEGSAESPRRSWLVRQFGPAWPLMLLLLGFPLWWALGLGELRRARWPRA